MHAVTDAVASECNRTIMSDCGMSRWEEFIAQKYALIALRWMLSHDRNRCWNPVKSLLGVLPFRCTATIFHFMDDSKVFGTAISGDKLFLNSYISLCNTARFRRSRCDVICNSWELFMLFGRSHDISQASVGQPLVIVSQMGVVYAV